MVESIHNMVLWNHIILMILSVAYMVQSYPPDEVALRFTNMEQEVITVTLMKKNSFLGNENLPVWSEYGNNRDELILHHEMMKNVGRFTIYQNSDLSSAAVYFHDLDAMFGTIDIRYIIQAFAPMELVNQSRITSNTTTEILVRDFPTHRYRRSKSIKQNVLPSFIDWSRKIGKKLPINTQSSVRSRRTSPQIIYVKLLVIIDYDLFENIKKGAYEKMGIVHYVLTLFNSVDMLFSKFNGLYIKMNIAGIVIRTKRDEFVSLEKCHRDDLIHNMKYMDTRCINSAVESSLKKYSKVIPLDSYHFPVFLTRIYNFFSHLLRSEKRRSNSIVAGVAFHEKRHHYQVKKMGPRILAVVIVKDEKYFGSFYTIAHEIVHALGFRSHDTSPYMDERKTCIAHIMKPRNDVCRNCLTWSSATRRMLSEIFSSRDRCFFIKKPLSLEKPRIQQIWTADEQCQCYGYVKARSPRTSLVEKMFRIPIKGCSKKLKCIDSDNFFHRAPIPLDGTPCGEDTDGVMKVCWNQQCRRVG